MRDISRDIIDPSSPIHLLGDVVDKSDEPSKMLGRQSSNGMAASVADPINHGGATVRA